MAGGDSGVSFDLHDTTDKIRDTAAHWNRFGIGMETIFLIQ
jgi:hypothetical protein